MGRTGMPSIVEGRAVSVQTRSEMRSPTYQELVWSFRVEQHDPVGGRVALVPVELRGHSFEGSLADGDRVRAHGRMRGGTFRATRIDNLTVGVTVRERTAHAWATVVVALVVLGFIAVVLVTVVRSSG